MSYIHLTIDKRSQIEVLRREGYSVRRIARLIGVHHSTVARELNRVEGEYSAIKAHQLAISKSANRGRPTKLTPQLAALIESRLQQTWSSEEIVSAELVGVLSFKTIYSWIHRGFLTVTETVLRRKGKKPSTQEKRGRFTVKRTIKERPQEVEDREVFGHWELDTMVSSRGESKGCLVTFVERKTRFYIAVKMEDRTKDSMFLAISSLYNTLTSKLLKTFTVDRGKEFACYEQVETKFGIPMYFADAYAAWQRGTNENSNGLLREFFPKKTDLAQVTLDKLREVLMLINNRPRKCLEFKTPFDMLKHEIRKLIYFCRITYCNSRYIKMENYCTC